MSKDQIKAARESQPPWPSSATIHVSMWLNHQSPSSHSSTLAQVEWKSRATAAFRTPQLTLQAQEAQ